jgi:diaminopimelate epimerase
MLKLINKQITGEYFRIMNYEIYSGAGNDFVMINNLGGTFTADKQAEFTVKVCEDYFKNIDGVIFTDKPVGKEAAIRMSYYNRDGSFGAMCGNGARCTAMYASDKNIVTGKKFFIEAVDKLYSAEMVSDKFVKIGFPDISDYNLNVHIELGSEPSIEKLHWMNVGSEHIMVFIEDIIAPKIKSAGEIKINEWGSAIRFHDAFQPKGANVNFIVKTGENTLRLRTYERGVERETLACGTGIISSAITAGLLGMVKPPVSVIVQSGETLRVDYNINGANVKDVFLEGSARKIGEGELK